MSWLGLLRDDPPLGAVEVFDGGLPTFQALRGTSPVNPRALLRSLRANPAKMLVGRDPVDQGAPAFAAGGLDQAVDLLGQLLRQEDPLPLEVSFQGSLGLKVEVPALLSFFQVLLQQVLKVMLELLVVHGAEEVPADLAVAWYLPSLALRQGHRGGWGRTEQVTGVLDKPRGNPRASTCSTRAKYTVTKVGQPGLCSAMRQHGENPYLPVLLLDSHLGF